LKPAKDYILGMKTTGTPFKAADTFPKANQDFWIRYWLAAGGINPDTDINPNCRTRSPNRGRHENGNYGCV